MRVLSIVKLGVIWWMGYNRVMKWLRKKRRLSRTVKVKGKRGVVYLSRPSKVSILLTGLAVTLWLGAFLTFSVPVIPGLWYRIMPGTSSALAQVLQRPVVSFEEVLIEEGEIEPYQPPFDESLPSENRLIIESIGVDTEIREAPYEEYESALKLGPWRVPDLGDPYDRRLPTIVAAHRFGYLAWTNQFRRENSFYNLPKLEEGDKVQIIWQNRKYEYEIYAADEGTEISDYTADLILYTCRFLESDIRIFRYARLVER